MQLNKIYHKRSGGRYLLMMLVIFLFSTCEYEVHKVYEREVNENVSPPEISVIELNLDHDTLFCYTQNQIRFKFASSDQDIQGVRFTVDNVPQYQVDSDNGVYNFDYIKFNNGVYTLTMEVYTTSGSGSIADKLNMESFLFSKSWVVVINKDYYYSVRSTISDGLLKLSWDRYRAYDFNEFIIYRERYHTKKEIARVKSNYFIDSSYVGETTRYYVEVSYGTSQRMSWVFLDLIKDLPKLRLDVSLANEYVLRWDKSKYYGAVETFNLLLLNGLKYYNIKSTIDPEDTSNLLTNPFGSILDLKLRLVPKNNLFYAEDAFYEYESKLTGYNGYPFTGDNFSALKQVSSNEFVYTSKCNSLIRYSVSELRTVESYSYQLSGCIGCKFMSTVFSASGKYIFSSVNCAHDILLANSLNFLDPKIRNLGFLSPIGVSDNGIMIANNSNGGFYLYDFINDSTLAFYNEPVFGRIGSSISIDGNYILLRYDSVRLLHYENSKFTNVWSNSRYTEHTYYEFDGVNPERMVFWDGQTFYIKSCKDFSTLNEFTLTESLLDIDYYNDRILTYSAGYLNIRSLLDGTLYKTIPYALNPEYSYNACHLVGKAVVNMLGVMYFIE